MTPRDDAKREGLCCPRPYPKFGDASICMNCGDPVRYNRRRPAPAAPSMKHTCPPDGFGEVGCPPCDVYEGRTPAPAAPTPKCDFTNCLPSRDHCEEPGHRHSTNCHSAQTPKEARAEEVQQRGVGHWDAREGPPTRPPVREDAGETVCPTCGVKDKHGLPDHLIQVWGSLRWTDEVLLDSEPDSRLKCAIKELINDIAMLLSDIGGGIPHEGHRSVEDRLDAIEKRLEEMP